MHGESQAGLFTDDPSSTMKHKFIHLYHHTYVGMEFIVRNFVCNQDLEMSILIVYSYFSAIRVSISSCCIVQR